MDATLQAIVEAQLGQLTFQCAALGHTIKRQQVYIGQLEQAVRELRLRVDPPAPPPPPAAETRSASDIVTPSVDGVRNGG